MQGHSRRLIGAFNTLKLITKEKRKAEQPTSGSTHRTALTRSGSETKADRRGEVEGEPKSRAGVKGSEPGRVGFIELISGRSAPMTTKLSRSATVTAMVAAKPRQDAIRRDTTRSLLQGARLTSY
jgi:hypothetical protein